MKNILKWSSNLAYAVGIITTDGNLSSDARHINITSKDLEQISNFANILNLTNKIGLKRGSFKKDNWYYVLQFGNVRFYKFLLSIGLHPNKTKTLRQLIIPDKYFADFLRGHLDGDGFTHSYWDKRWKSSFMLYTDFISASSEHLLWIQKKISDLFQVSGSIKYAGKSTYQLIYAKRSSLLLLRRLYYSDDVICLSRKRFKIEMALGIIDKHAGMLESVDRHA